MSLNLEEKEDEYRNIFNMFSRNSDGNIHTQELGIVLRGIGLTPTQEQLDTYEIRINQKSEDGLLDFDEFIEIMKFQLEFEDFGDVAPCLDIFSRNADGLISVAEMKNVLTSNGEALTEIEFDEILEEAKIQPDGFISVEKFMNEFVEKSKGVFN
eukprot:TRINITY_DN623_c0_g2_i1.p1 TRINITY_DN623_c0_g2~~TRINITY_DN623_c0_g2_i1.p1  ORF type:complete len:162 (-),score=38.92 TRINITY_DN623_c0_g2_i1:59-523(-)